MRIKFKHILFLISLLAFLGAMKAYAGLNEDLEDQLKELEALNNPHPSAVQSVGRAPAHPVKPVALPQADEEELIEVADYTTQDSFAITAKTDIKAEKPKKTELTKHAEDILTFMTKEIIPTVSIEKERTVATEENKPFNYAAKKYQDHRRSDRELKTAKREDELWQIKNGYRLSEIRPVIQNDGSFKIAVPEEPLFAMATRQTQAKQQQAAQEQTNIEDFQRNLNLYKQVLTSPQTTSQQLNDIIQRYQDLLIQPNTTPATKEKMPSGQEIWTSTLPPTEQAKQDTILQSLQDTLVELQAKGEQERVTRIVDDIIMAKLIQASDVSNPDSYPDPKSYKDTLKLLRKVRNYKDPKDPTKDRIVAQKHEFLFKKHDTDLKDKVQDIEKLLDESILNALNEDFSGNLSSAVAQLNTVADMLKNSVVTLAAIRKMPPEDLLQSALGKNGENPEERFAAIQALMALMEDSTTGLGIYEGEKQALLDFLNNEFLAYLAQKKEECNSTDQSTIHLDEKKLEELTANFGKIEEKLSDLSSHTRSLVSQRLENVKQLLAQIKAKFAIALKEDKEGKRILTDEQRRLCKQGFASCGIGIDAVTQTQQASDSRLEAEDFANPSLEQDNQKNQ